MSEQEKRNMLLEALQKRGFYSPHDVFNHPPQITPINDSKSKYEFKVEIHKWNTSSSQLIRLSARWDKKQQRYILSTYNTGSVKRQKHGEKMR